LLVLFLQCIILMIMKIYCSGIGGIGLSAYAAMQKANGHQVMGSDRGESALIQDLRSQGIEVFLSQDGSHVPSDAELFVYSEAVPEDAPERLKAAEYGIRAISYFAALGELSKDRFVIAVCGTHGKSSTTAMAARVLIKAGKDPSVIVGTKVPELGQTSPDGLRPAGGRNWRKGSSDLFLVEACEYRRSFHYLSPDLILVTNVDGDHFDAYADLQEYQEAFAEFFRLLPEDGVVIGHLDDAQSEAVIRGGGHDAVDADTVPLPEVGVPGEHMRQNARLALAMAMKLGIPEQAARSALKGFAGTWRRMERKGTGKHGGPVIDDYGHHPVEIRATLAAVREAYPGKRIVCVFQPHMHDRMRKLYDEFLTSFTDCDVVVVTDVYSARLKPGEELVDLPKLVADLARVSGKEVINGESLEQAERMLPGILKPEDVLVCMGAGDITNLAGRLVA
jgi:UDP-N-acetylmuramate--alanine ligase